METVTGQITSIQPTNGYQSQNGWIYTFDMVVQTPQGLAAGEIGSKSQVYPLTTGQEITVEKYTHANKPKLKKINPQYQQQNAQQQPPAQGGPPAQSSAAPNKDRIIATQVVFKALVERSGEVDENVLITNVDMIMRVGSGQALPRMSPTDGGENGPPPTDDNGPPPTDEEIPF